MSDPGNPGNIADKMGAVGQAAAQNVGGLEKEIKAADKATQRLVLTQEEFNKKVRESIKAIQEEVKTTKEAADINERFSAGLKGLFTSAVQNTIKFGSEIDQIRAKANEFGSVWQTAFGKGNKTFDDLRARSQETAISLRRLAEQGKITYDQLQGLSSQAARMGVDFGEALKTMDQGKGLDLVNQGYFELDEAMTITGDSMKKLGADSAGASTVLLTTAAAIEKVQRETHKGVLSTHQLAEEVGVLQEQFKYLGVDAERLPGVIAAFAIQADKARSKGTWAPTGAVAADIGTSLVSDMAKMSPERASFFGQMGGMGGGLAAGVRFQDMMKHNIGGAAASMMQTVQQLSGGNFVSGAQVVNARNPAEAERLAELREQQIQIVQETTGRGREDAMGLVESGAGGGLIEALKKIVPKEDIGTLTEHIARDQKSTTEGVKTIAERVENLKMEGLQIAASYEQAVIGVAIGAEGLKLAETFLPFLKVIADWASGGSLATVLTNLLGGTGPLGKLLKGAGGVGLSIYTIEKVREAWIEASKTIENDKAIAATTAAASTNATKTAFVSEEFAARAKKNPQGGLQSALFNSQLALKGLGTQFGGLDQDAHGIWSHLTGGGGDPKARAASDAAIKEQVALSESLRASAGGSLSSDQLHSTLEELMRTRDTAMSTLSDTDRSSTRGQEMMKELRDLTESINVIIDESNKLAPTKTAADGTPMPTEHTVKLTLDLETQLSKLHDIKHRELVRLGLALGGPNYGF